MVPAANNSITASQNLTDYRRNIFFNPSVESMLSKSQDLRLVSPYSLVGIEIVAHVFRVSLVQPQ